VAKKFKKSPDEVRHWSADDFYFALLCIRAENRAQRDRDENAAREAEAKNRGFV
jgi:hypothetical protein